MKIMILGGDGFCGWPTSLHLSAKGHDIVIVDNLSRRSIDIELEVESLTPIRPIGERLRVWKAATGRDISFVNLDLATQYSKLLSVLQEFRPDAIVHFAEQRAAPYSMRSPKAKRYTVDNNVRGTHNLLCALTDAELDAAVVHLGTMGVYGYGWSGSAPIPEGYLAVKVPTPDGELVREILHPANPGSVYHMTKTLDQLLFAFYAKNDGVRITDLHQGIVWGTQTNETGLDERLVNRFDYDGDYGTVLNRFLMQAAIGHPLTVHGTGGQTQGVHPHPRHRPLCRDSDKQPSRHGRASVGVQPDDRSPQGEGPGSADLQAHRCRSRDVAEPPQGSRRERPRGAKRAFPVARAQPDDSFGRPARGGPPDRQQVPRPGRHLEDRGPLCLAQGHGSRT